MAGRLQISRGYYSELRSGKKVPSAKIIKLLCYSFGISERWLLTGEGEMFDENGRPDGSAPDPPKARPPSAREPTPPYDMADLLYMTTYVLEAKHATITPALEANIIAFYLAVKKEEEAPVDPPEGSRRQLWLVVDNTKP